MSKRKPFNFLILLILLISHLLFLNEGSIIQTDEDHDESKVYIVYMGKKPHDDVQLISSTHHKILIDVLGSKEASAEAMIYSYRHGFSGFAAKLTRFQAQKIADSHGVIHVIPNHFYKLHTTRSWDYLGLSPHQSPTNLLQDSDMGDGTIIGILDSGIWPDHEAFSDKGLGPIPSKWKGTCESGPQFNATKSCNKKIIGARFFFKGFLYEYQKLHNTTKINDPLSPIDINGHGTHTASIASGTFLLNVSYHGLGHGMARGGAPRARLAIYKVCWNFGRCAYADVLKAFDKAIHDGIDILSLSLGLEIPLSPEINRQNAINFASLHAVENGIVVVCAAGNSGPIVQTVTNTAPWILTVGASTIDRSFPTSILLGNNQTIMGEAIFTGADTGFRQLVYPEVSSPLLPPRYCDSLTQNDTWIAGKIVLCFHTGKTETIFGTILAVQLVGGMGIIVAKNPTKFLDYFTNDFPSVQVSYDIGTKILNYIRSTRNSLARLMPSKTYLGKPVSTKVAYFSSRGPNSIAPEVLKPDVAAPGVNILGAFPPEDPNKGIDHYFLSGTSMAAPHVSGIVALLKSLHPQWSPAAIKSAIVTTASTTDSSGEPIFAEGDPTKLADAFDFGGGIIDPNKARDPGLVYDMGITDYVNYLCAMGYNSSSINQLLGRTTPCPQKDFSLLDLNLPSIVIPSLSNSTTVTRIVSNVGPLHSTYKAIIEPPKGTRMQVNPDVLIFNSKVKKIAFTITIETDYKVNIGYSFGSLTWTDGKHEVRTPISVRTEFFDFYAY